MKLSENKQMKTCMLINNNIYGIYRHLIACLCFPGSSVVKNLPAMQETQVQGQEDPLEEGMTTHSSILAWRIPVDRSAWQATISGVTKSQTQLKQLNTQHTQA